MVVWCSYRGKNLVQDTVLWPLLFRVPLLLLPFAMGMCFPKNVFVWCTMLFSIWFRFLSGPFDVCTCLLISKGVWLGTVGSGLGISYLRRDAVSFMLLVSFFGKRL